MYRGKYTRDLYILPTLLIHNGDGIYHLIEIAWLKWFVGFRIGDTNECLLLDNRRHRNQC